MTAFIELSNVSLRYPGGDVLALDSTDMKIGEGDFVAVVGPSGCGKSTILKLVAGLIPATAGNVVVEQREVRGPASGYRDATARMDAGSVGCLANVRFARYFCTTSSVRVKS